MVERSKDFINKRQWYESAEKAKQDGAATDWGDYIQEKISQLRTRSEREDELENLVRYARGGAKSKNELREWGLAYIAFLEDQERVDGIVDISEDDERGLKAA